MTTDWLVLGHTWSEGEPCLRLRPHRDGGPTELRPLREGQRLDMWVSPVRACIGAFRDGTRLPCPERAELGDTGGAQCPRCVERDTFRPCMTCDGFRCPRLTDAARAHCRSTHHLYLACFGDPVPKVGTAADHRREQRIIEQGPLAAARVACGEGPRIKQIETLLVRAGFAGTMRRSRKALLLGAGMGVDEARGRIEAAAADLPVLLPATHHDLLHPPRFVEQPPLATASRRLTVHPMPIEGGATVEGTVIGAVGHVVFLDDGDGTFAVDLGLLRARVVTFDRAGPKRRPAVQLGLF